MLDSLIQLKPQGLPTFLLIPVLYGLGWITVRPLEAFGLTTENLALIGTLISFLLFVLLMPRWTHLRWGARNGWRVLGLSGGGQGGRPSPTVAWLRGTGLAGGLLLLVVIVVFMFFC